MNAEQRLRGKAMDHALKTSVWASFLGVASVFIGVAVLHQSTLGATAVLIVWIALSLLTYHHAAEWYWCNNLANIARDEAECRRRFLSQL